ncbi:MAG: hypothetical protein WCP97_01315 [bacterium]
MTYTTKEQLSESSRFGAQRVTLQTAEYPNKQHTYIGIFDSGSGGMVAASWAVRVLHEQGLDFGVIFFGDTKNLPYGPKGVETVAGLADDIIATLSRYCPVIGIACNTASISWKKAGKQGKEEGKAPQVIGIIEAGAKQAYEKAIAQTSEQYPERRCKRIGIIGTELTVNVQAHAEKILLLHRDALSEAIGHQLPIIPYEKIANALKPSLASTVINYNRTPHIALIREHEDAHHGGATRGHLFHYDPPPNLPHDVEIISRDGQKLVTFVDEDHILTEYGSIKKEWKVPVKEYLNQISEDLRKNKITSLVLGCTHFEYFSNEFGKIFPTMEARQGIIAPSAVLALDLITTMQKGVHESPKAEQNPNSNKAPAKAYFYFSGDQPTRDTFETLEIPSATLVQDL